jgi:hypothetical protein
VENMGLGGGRGWLVSYLVGWGCEDWGLFSRLVTGDQVSKASFTRRWTLAFWRAGRAAMEVLGELGYIMDVAALRGTREIADTHVFDHALS